MANDITSSQLPLAIAYLINGAPKPKYIDLPLDRRIGEPNRNTYVHSNRLPLRLERFSADRLSSSSHLALSLTNPIATIADGLFFYAEALPLPLTTAVVKNKDASTLPLALTRRLNTAKSDFKKPKPKQQKINVEGIFDSVVSTPVLSSSTRSIDAAGVQSLQMGVVRTRVLPKEGYVLSSGLLLPLSSEIEARPKSSRLPFPLRRKLTQFLNRPDISPNNNQYLYPKTFLYSVVSTGVQADLHEQYVATPGFESLLVGAGNIKNARDFVKSFSWVSSEQSSSHSIVNNNKELRPTGFAATLYGSHLSYNLRQFAPLQGKDQSLYGTAYVQGGVKWLYPVGPLTTIISNVKVVNLSANRVLLPAGIAGTAIVPAPIITPHMIYARGIYSTLFGLAVVVPTPVLKHKGVNHLVAGTPTVWYHTRPLAPSGFESYDTGYPKVFDPTQFIQPSAFNRTAIFGDTYAKNVWTFVKGAGAIDSQAIGEWAKLENKNRAYIARGFLSQAFGGQLIKNKSPSIFFHGLPAPTFYNQAIGYRIRTIAPIGFDRLGLGKPVAIKTPELFPHSYIATQFGEQWVSNRTRYVAPYGSSYGANGVPTVWFRFRYARPNSWQSSVLGGGSTITHGVREIIGNGFIRQAYGIGWVSRGTRLLEPAAIYKDQTSNHYVGRHQEIKPVGYIATRFGTRIIPEIQAVYPLGFAGVFGLTTAYLQTQYLQPRGYQTSGEQQAYRWGRQIVYNSAQYIVQNFDGDNGLVPPKWSDWTAIENRNKAIVAIGTNMLRFGYAQIDNGARILEPQGLIGTRFGKSMIAYRIRYLPLQGIEQPHMSDWLVVHNAARVIQPAGEIQSLFGNTELVKTRRYLERIGRIESFESGSPMVAYRIRKLEIERRYSIAPPIIRLPTVDLYTRYVGFNGYETAKYGLASLSIHFRIITPRWTHNEKSGYPALRNVTPELKGRGHDSQEYGNASIRTEWRFVLAKGDADSVVGKPLISDTKQYVFNKGWLSLAPIGNVKVIKTGTNPYITQYVWLNDESGSGAGEGSGISPLIPHVGAPALNQNVLYPKGFITLRAGTAFLWSNNIVIESGIAINGVGTGGIVENSDNVIGVTSGIAPTFNVSDNIRLSPHTIWAVKEAPAQAIRNHDANGLHYVGEIDGEKGSVRYGRPSVESTIRSIFPSAFEYYKRSVFGTPKLDLKTKKVSIDGFRLSKFGIPSIPFTPQAVTIREGIAANVFGVTVFSRPPYTGPQYIKPQGLNELRFGRTYSDNFTRTLMAIGNSSLNMGMSKPSDTPFMWQGLRIGEHVPLIIGGDDTSRHGLTWVSLRVRELVADGFYAFKSEYELSSFSEKMTVKNSDKRLPVTNAIGVEGIYPTSSIGYQDLKFGQRYIRPDGNSDQFRKGGYHA